MTGTASVTSSAAPLPKHAWSKQYFRLRAIAILVGIPARFLISLRRILVKSREKGRDIKVDVYEPANHEKGSLPVHINWHGSGFVIPCFGDDSQFCSYVASTLGCIVLDCDYRKAPANPYPAGPQDAEDVCNYVIAHPELYDKKKITLGGTSAGGCLALGAAAKLGPTRVQAVCCIAPATDLRPQTKPKAAHDPGRHRMALPSWAVRYFLDCYLAGDNVNRSDPICSPICAETSDFPSTVYIAVGTGDTLYYDGKGLIDRLTSDGLPSAQFRPMVGMGHAPPQMFNPNDPNNIPLQMYQDIVNNIEKSWSQPQVHRESKM